MRSSFDDRPPRRPSWRPVALALLGLVTVATAMEPSGSPASNAAVQQCDAIADHPTDADRAAIDAALASAEQAVAADGKDPKAHFAVFCALAKRTALDGFAVRSLLAVRRLHREIDTALELAPDYGDALIAKGGFLLQLPSLLGGDAHEAARLLSRAATLEPDRISARLYLAEAYAALDQPNQARAEARNALQLAEQAGRPQQASEARETLKRLGP